MEKIANNPPIWSTGEKDERTWFPKKYMTDEELQAWYKDVDFSTRFDYSFMTEMSFDPRMSQEKNDEINRKSKLLAQRYREAFDRFYPETKRRFDNNEITLEEALKCTPEHKLMEKRERLRQLYALKERLLELRDKK